MAIDKIVIIGAGTMGQGIARTIAETGTEVVLYDLSDEILKKSLDFVSDSLDREIEKWGITKSEKKAILSRIKTSTDVKIARKARVIIEAIPESLEMKRELFKQLDELCPPETVFISNTSTLSITQLASATNRPQMFIGMHFLNPVHKIPMVELVRGLKTSTETYAFTQDFAVKLNKKPIPVNEYPGYVTATRVLTPDAQIYAILWSEMHVRSEVWNFPLFLNTRDLLVPIKYEPAYAPSRLFVRLARNADS